MKLHVEGQEVRGSSLSWELPGAQYHVVGEQSSAELSWSVLAVQTSKSPRRINKRSDYD